MKFGDKIYTYKDIDEAKKLIGKKVIVGNYYRFINEIEQADGDCVKTLLGVAEGSAEPFITENVCRCQFIREVIEEEPTYRPFNSVEELIEHWEKNYGNSNRPKGTMPLIWVKHKNNNLCFLITRYETNKNSVCVSESSQWFNLENLFEFYEFLDGKPTGVEE